MLTDVNKKLRYCWGLLFVLFLTAEKNVKQFNEDSCLISSDYYMLSTLLLN